MNLSFVCALYHQKLDLMQVNTYFTIYTYIYIIYIPQEFIQALLLMSTFQQKLSFNVAKFRLLSQGAVSSATTSWQSPGEGSGGKELKIFGLFTS